MKFVTVMKQKEELVSVCVKSMNTVLDFNVRISDG